MNRFLRIQESLICIDIIRSFELVDSEIIMKTRDGKIQGFTCLNNETANKYFEYLHETLAS